MKAISVSSQVFGDGINEAIINLQPLDNFIKYRRMPKQNKLKAFLYGDLM